MLYGRNKYNIVYNYPSFKNKFKGFPGGSVVKNMPANARDMSSIPGLGRSHMLWSNKVQEPRTATTEPSHCNY